MSSEGSVFASDIATVLGYRSGSFAAFEHKQALTEIHRVSAQLERNLQNTINAAISPFTAVSAPSTLANSQQGILYITGFQVGHSWPIFPAA